MMARRVDDILHRTQDTRERFARAPAATSPNCEATQRGVSPGALRRVYRRPWRSRNFESRCRARRDPYVLATSQQIADRFLQLSRNMNRGERAGAKQHGQVTPASRRSVLIRSPGRRGISVGAMTSQSNVMRGQERVGARSRTGPLRNNNGRDREAQLPDKAAECSGDRTRAGAAPARRRAGRAPRPRLTAC